MGSIIQMINTPCLDISVTQQIEYINLEVLNKYSSQYLCFYMGCPTDTNDHVINCSKCIGSLEMEYLRKIQPELDLSNMVQTLLTWNLLLK